MESTLVLSPLCYDCLPTFISQTISFNGTCTMTALLVISVLVTGTYLLHSGSVVCSRLYLPGMCMLLKWRGFSNESVSTRQTWLLISRVCYSESGRAGRLVGVLGFYLTQGQLCPLPTDWGLIHSLSQLSSRKRNHEKEMKGGGVGACQCLNYLSSDNLMFLTCGGQRTLAIVLP